MHSVMSQMLKKMSHALPLRFLIVLHGSKRVNQSYLVVDVVAQRRALECGAVYLPVHEQFTHDTGRRAPAGRDEHQVGGITKRKGAGLLRLPSLRLQPIQGEEYRKGSGEDRKEEYLWVLIKS